MAKMMTIVAMCSLAVSCCTEELVVSSTADNFISNPVLTEKLSRMVQYPTSVDNMIDGTSCFAIKMPYTVIVNTETVTVNDENDYAYISGLLADNSVEDSIEIQFPVTVIYADYSETVFTAESQFANAVAGCNESGEISCVGFSYPVIVNAYRAQDREAEKLSINSNLSFYNLLKYLENYDAIQLGYPTGLLTPAGSIQQVNNTVQLESVIDDFAGSCQDDPGPGPEPELLFENIISQGTWYISYFFKESDETGDYVIYHFTFHSSGNISVTAGSGITTGTWETITDDGEQKAVFTFSSPNLEELEEDWTIVSVTQNLIKMEHESGGGDEIRYFYLSKN